MFELLKVEIVEFLYFRISYTKFTNQFCQNRWIRFNRKPFVLWHFAEW